MLGVGLQLFLRCPDWDNPWLGVLALHRDDTCRGQWSSGSPSCSSCCPAQCPCLWDCSSVGSFPCLCPSVEVLHG
eukprot:5588259-Pyramimonas_sp.AAC.1